MSLYPQAPQSIGKVLDGGFTMYRAVFKAILPLSIAVAVFAQLPGLWPFLVNPADLMHLSTASGLMLLAGFVVWFALYMALYAGWLKSLDALARGGSALNVGAAFSAGLPKVLPMLGATILFTIALMIGLCLLVIPGVILMVSLMFFWYLIVLEDQGAIASLRNSHKLVWGNWWRTAAILTVAAVIYLVAVLVVFGVIGAIVGMSAWTGPKPEQMAAGPGVAVLVLIATQVLLNALLLPMFMSVTLVTLRDLQLRQAAPAATG
jgi:hypothetical protein